MTVRGLGLDLLTLTGIGAALAWAARPFTSSAIGRRAAGFGAAGDPDPFYEYVNECW